MCDLLRTSKRSIGLGGTTSNGWLEKHAGPNKQKPQLDLGRLERDWGQKNGGEVTELLVSRSRRRDAGAGAVKALFRGTCHTCGVAGQKAALRPQRLPVRSRQALMSNCAGVGPWAPRLAAAMAQGPARRARANTATPSWERATTETRVVQVQKGAAPAAQLRTENVGERSVRAYLGAGASRARLVDHGRQADAAHAGKPEQHTCRVYHVGEHAGADGVS